MTGGLKVNSQWRIDAMDAELMEKLHNSLFIESACSSDTLSMYNLGRCLWAGKTDFCEAVIAESPVYGKVLFIDKELQSSASDEVMYHEHLVHPVMTAKAHVNAKKVLVVGGGEGATVREVLKWDSVASVDWVDIDGKLVDLCRIFLKYADEALYSDPRVTYKADDILNFLQSSNTLYDVIILDLPDPDVETLESAGHEEFELYGPKFWDIIRGALTPDGAIVSHAGPVSPGADEKARRAGLAWIQQSTHFPASSSYHCLIPSFQGEWGFWMSCAPRFDVELPRGLRIMNNETMKYAFTWPSYWNANF